MGKIYGVQIRFDNDKGNPEEKRVLLCNVRFEYINDVIEYLSMDIMSIIGEVPSKDELKTWVKGFFAEHLPEIMANVKIYD